MKIFAVCLQIDPKSNEWGLSAWFGNSIHSERWQCDRGSLRGATVAYWNAKRRHGENGVFTELHVLRKGQ